MGIRHSVLLLIRASSIASPHIDTFASVNNEDCNGKKDACVAERWQVCEVGWKLKKGHMARLLIGVPSLGSRQLLGRGSFPS